MKKAFTLIELLVVIAIIAILAAILFPVFAQAKAAAKKTVALSNVKQVSTGMFLYLGDNDDTYPRQSSCVQNSSLNPKFQAASYNGGALQGCSGGLFYNQVNQYTWQKYLMPYVKSEPLFEHPMRAKDATQWDTQGQLYGGIVLNLGFTGVKNVSFTTGATSAFGDLNPVVGGTQSNFPDPSAAGMFFDNVPFSSQPFAPVIDYQGANSSTSPLNTYPLAIREYWRYRLMKQTAAECTAGTGGTQVDPSKALTGGIIVGKADGSAKFMTGGAFLGATPTKAEFLNGGSITGTDPTCDATKVAQGYGASSEPNKNLNYPLWGLSGSN